MSVWTSSAVVTHDRSMRAGSTDVPIPLIKTLLCLSWLLGLAAITLSIGASGFRARMMVYAFLAGIAASVVATLAAFGTAASKTVRRAGIVSVAVYVSVVALLALWLWIANPPFG
jgi:hypothetical protein